jgi:hypothetical protein
MPVISRCGPGKSAPPLQARQATTYTHIHSCRIVSNRIVKDKSSSLLFLCTIAITFAGCHHIQSPWDGQWTLNPAKSHYAAPTFSVAISPSGEYRVDNGAFDYSFLCDGREYSAASGHTTSCTQISSRAIALKGLADAVSTNARWELSADGKTLTITADRIQIDGSSEDDAGHGVVKKQEKVFERISGSSGFTGQWREMNPLEALSKTVVLILNYNAFHFENAETGQVSDSRADNPATSIRGANQPAGFTRYVQILGPRQLQTEDTFEGRVILRTSWKVSDDGHTLYEETWVPQNPTQKDLLVYQKP